MLLNQDQVEQHVLDIIKSAQDPAQGVAQALVFILRTLKEKSNGMPMQALGQASHQILAEILKMAEAAQVVQVTPEFLRAVMQAIKGVLGPQQQPAPAAPAGQPPRAPRVAGPLPQEASAEADFASGFKLAAPLLH
jgi:hypothetical protein